MVVRVERALFDPTGIGATGSGVPVFDDGTRNPATVERPSKGREEYVVSEAMRQMLVPAAQIRKTRPPVPIAPPKGDFVYDHRPVTIEEVLDTDRWAPKRRSWVSPNVRPIRRADMQEDQWSGTLRNVSSTTNPLM